MGLSPVQPGPGRGPARVSAGRGQIRRRSWAGLLLALPSCASIGPATVSRDRIGYLAAVGESWKEQTLLNIVRLRYSDAPTFLDVSSIISGYGLQGQVSA